MTLFAARAAAVRNVSRKAPVRNQKRYIVDYLTNYPDKVREETIDIILDANRKKTRRWTLSLACSLNFLLSFSGCWDEEDSMRWRNFARRSQPHLDQTAQWQARDRRWFPPCWSWPYQGHHRRIPIGFRKGKDRRLIVACTQFLCPIKWRWMMQRLQTIDIDNLKLVSFFCCMSVIHYSNTKTTRFSSKATRIIFIFLWKFPREIDLGIFAIPFVPWSCLWILDRVCFQMNLIFPKMDVPLVVALQAIP